MDLSQQPRPRFRLNGIIYATGKWIAVGESGSIVAVSDTGEIFSTSSVFSAWTRRDSAKTNILNAVDPALDAFGVVGSLLDPQITVTRTNSTIPVATNDNWNTQLAPTNSTFSAADIRDYTARAGAFALPENSRASALLFTTTPGANYTVQVSGVAATAGLALVEVYDVTGL